MKSHGRLIKNAEALERFEKVDTLVVDKTGTLSEGKPRVVAVVSGEEYHEAAVFAFAASLERSSARGSPRPLPHGRTRGVLHCKAGPIFARKQARVSSRP